MLTAQLYAPASFVSASTRVRSRVTNGCGPAGWKYQLIPDRIWGLDIRIACDVHDWMYSAGETIEDKDAADRTFHNNILRLIAAAGGPWWLQKLRRMAAYRYYKAVSIAGGPAFWQGKNLNTELFTVELKGEFDA